jgi:hypothetical protein
MPAAGTPVTTNLLTGRTLPAAIPDQTNPPGPPRGDRFGGAMVTSRIPNKYVLADEGCYFHTTMLPGATGLQLGISASFSATAAALVFQNTDSLSNPLAKRVYLDRIKLIVNTVPTSATGLYYATVIDNVNRAPTAVSGNGAPGTAATQTAYQTPRFNCNMDLASASVCQPYFPLSTSAGAPPVVPAAGPNARTIVGNGIIRNVIPVANDEYKIIFGAEGEMTPFAPTVSTVARIVEYHPPVVIGPGASFLLYLWAPSNIIAGVAFTQIEAGWYEF